MSDTPLTQMTTPLDRPSASRAPGVTSAATRGRALSKTVSAESEGMVTKLRLADGRIYEGALTRERHLRMHLGLLHDDSDGYVEIAAGRRPPGGKLRITTRRDPGHFLPGGASGKTDWLERLLELVARHHSAGEEVFVSPAVRSERVAGKAHVAHTSWLWIDVDGDERLPAVRRLLRRKAPHLVIESAGSGGLHCYWRLRSPLHSREEGGGEAIEAAHEQLIYALGYAWENGRPTPTVADGACRDRSRVMRLAGTINAKTGRHARIMWGDLALPGWQLEQLIGDLPPAPKPRAARRSAAAPFVDDDPYKRIAPVDYFRALAGIEVPRHGLVSCPSPAHADSTPSCHVGRHAGEGWCCHGCGAAGAIYDLASVLLGGPTGSWLRGEQFRRAREHVRETFGGG